MLMAVGIACTAGESLRDGSSEERAIIIGPRSIAQCVNSEHAYIHSRFPDVFLDGFLHGTIVDKRGRWYDVFRFNTANGSKHELYFDSTLCVNSTTPARK